MNFGRPVQFSEAVTSLRVRKQMPTSLTTDQLAQLPAQLRENAFFSARVLDTHFLQLAQDLIDQIIGQQDINDGSYPARPGQIMDRSLARLKLKEYLASIQYLPEVGEAGTLTDLSSNGRLNLILDTQIQMNAGRGRYIKQQDPDLLDMWPCSELVRVGRREAPREEVDGADQFSSRDGFGGEYWPQVWEVAGGQFYGPRRRMIARKNDPIWIAINKDFGHPYPPFAWRSGMGLRDIRRDEAESLGVIGINEVIEPDPNAAEMPEPLPQPQLSNARPDVLRWPEGDPEGRGGQFRPKGGDDAFIKGYKEAKARYETHLDPEYAAITKWVKGEADFAHNSPLGKLISSAMEKLPLYTTPVTLYRGLTFSSKHEASRFIDESIKNGVIEVSKPGVVAASLSDLPKIAAKFAVKEHDRDPDCGVIMEILSQKSGRDYGAVVDISEAEVLMPSKAKFAVLGVSKKDYLIRFDVVSLSTLFLKEI